jgi:hypothetical protein
VINSIIVCSIIVVICHILSRDGLILVISICRQHQCCILQCKVWQYSLVCHP